MIIDAKNLILGRMGSHVAKRAMLGEDVIIVNADQAVISGAREVVLEKYRHIRFDRTTPRKGPFIGRAPHLLVRRIIRGMLPYDRNKGRLAYKRIRCYSGMPKEYEGKAETIASADYHLLPHRKVVRMAEISAFIGGKQ